MTLIVGMLATADGHSLSRSVTKTAYGYETRSAAYVSPAQNYRAEQPAHIVLDWEHDHDPVGQVLYLGHRAGGLYAVCEADDDVAEWLPDPCYLSAELMGRWDERTLSYDDLELRSVALVARSANIGKWPLRKVAGTIDDAYTRWANPQRPLLREAADYVQQRRYRRHEPHRIAGLPVEYRRTEEPPLARGVPGAIEFGPLGRVLAVR